eukprot:3466685-Pleurochrysis_carterae.AAC.1
MWDVLLRPAESNSQNAIRDVPLPALSGHSKSSDVSAFYKSVVGRTSLVELAIGVAAAKLSSKHEVGCLAHQVQHDGRAFQVIS